jgi:hypothetical protein
MYEEHIASSADDEFGSLTICLEDLSKVSILVDRDEIVSLSWDSEGIIGE